MRTDLHWYITYPSSEVVFHDKADYEAELRAPVERIVGDGMILGHVPCDVCKGQPNNRQEGAE